MATPTELARVAALATALRPDWPTRSVLTFLEREHATKAYRDLAVAMAHIACDPTTQTPKRLSESGPWWLATADPTATAVPAATDPRCTVYGHEHYRLPCRGCRAEALAADVDDATTLTTLPPEQIERNARGAHLVRQALRQHTATPTTRQPDVRELAAGEREDDR